MRIIYIWDRIVSFFAGNNLAKNTKKAISEATVAKKRYSDTNKINFTAIFASKLSNLAVSEANAEVLFDDRVISEGFRDVWRRAKQITAAALGVGGVFLIPYYKEGSLYTDVLTQERVFIGKTLGGKICEATILAESIRKRGQSFVRWAHYSLDEDGLVISQMATAGGEIVPLYRVEEWEDISPEVRIEGATSMPFAYLKSPADSKEVQEFYGVPITYGCEALIEEIHEHLAAIRREYKIKQSFIGADSMLFSAEGELPEEGIFKLLSPLGSERDFWQEFNPEIREKPYYTRLNELYRALEAAVGTSRGILTEVTSGGATATEIKRARYDTFSLVEEIRRNWEYAACELLEAFCMLIGFYLGEKPKGVKACFDWSYSLYESSEETFAQLVSGYREKVISAAELRQFLKPSETIFEAEESIKKIREKNEEEENA